MKIQIKTTDLSKKKLTKKQVFLDKNVSVISRSGLHHLETALIHLFEEHNLGQKVLFIENRTGAAPLVYQQLFPDSIVHTLNLDKHHSSVINRTMNQNNLNCLTIFTEAYIPNQNYYETIVIQAPKDMEGELLQDLIQNSYQQLNKNGRLLILHQGKIQSIKNLLKNLFDGFTNLLDKKQAQIEIAKKKDNVDKQKSYSAEFTLTRHLKEAITLSSIPGVFAHRRVDQGAQALIEVVEVLPNQKILDMGCGCGSIGIALAKDTPNVEVHFVDSSARAIYSTDLNCKKMKIENYKTILSDTGIVLENYFDIYTGNPPYFSDFKIAQLFLDNAFKSLKLNGMAFIVAKSIAWHEENMKLTFGNCEVITRRGYKIAKSIKTKN